uniref:Uncharacterized protein n=1 Tax=viral metagenome TaxID=1070528 RepID=A0A6M3KE07_9ZZZZ
MIDLIILDLQDMIQELKNIKCSTCLHWKVFQSNQQWGTCSAIRYPHDCVGEDYASMSAEIYPQEAADCLNSIGFETNREFSCKLWSKKLNV